MKRRKWKVVLLSAPLLALTVAMMVAAQLRPVEVNVSDGDTHSVAMLRRLGVEMKRHPYAPVMTVMAYGPDGFVKRFSYNRRRGTFMYLSRGNAMAYGWSYSAVNEPAATIIAQSGSPQEDFPKPIYKTLKKYGCKFDYIYSPYTDFGLGRRRNPNTSL